MEATEMKFGEIVLDHSFRDQELKDELDQTVKDKARLQEELDQTVKDKARLQEELDQTVKDKARLQEELDQTVNDKARLQEELDLKTEQVEQLFRDIRGLEHTNQEDLSELQQVKSDLKCLMEEKNVWEERADKITEDNTQLIETVLASQYDLGKQLNRKTAVLNAFSARVSKLAKNTRRIIEGGEDENVRCSEGGDDEMGNVIQVMTWPLEEELKAIEAAALEAIGAVGGDGWVGHEKLRGH